MLATPPAISPKIPYTADDLPSVIHGTVTEEDLSQTINDLRYINTHCAVAVSLKRMFPGIEQGQFSIGTRIHIIGRRHYHIDDQGRAGIENWCVGLKHTFDYTLTEA